MYLLNIYGDSLPKRLRGLAELSPIACVQRLDYLIELVGAREKVEGIAGYIAGKRPIRTPLAP